MSVTTISPIGTVAVYNDAYHIKWDYAGGVGLFTGKDQYAEFIARIPRDHVVSFNHPCRIEHHGIPVMTLNAALEIVEAGCESIKGRQNMDRLASLKRKLDRFNMRYKMWTKRKGAR